MGMTEQEALKELECAVIDTNAYEVCKKALEKQIAKKPIYKPYDDTCVYYEYACPDCEEWLDRISKPHHCKCGQKLDWGNEDERTD